MQRESFGQRLIDVELEDGQRDLLKAILFDGKDVVTGEEIDDGEGSVSGGCFAADDVSFLIDDGDAGVWVDAVVGVIRLRPSSLELPPPGQGIAALQMLNLLEPYDLKGMGPNSAEYWHLLVEAKKVAFADRAKYYTDPVFAKVPVETLVSKAYADERRKLIDPKHALTDIPPGDAKLGKAETIYKKPGYDPL